MASAWKINSEELQFNETEENFIGEGGYGKVYRGEWGGVTVAIKKLHVKKLTTRAEKEYLKEIQLLWGLHHSGLVKFFGAVMKPGFYAMVMELMEGGALYYMLHDDDIELSWLRKCKILHAISAGVEYLHSHNIIHRDLKSLNVLLDKELNPKLCDFGLAVVKVETESQAPSTRKANAPSAIGTIRWLAPEVMQGHSHSKHSDVWALGLIVAEVVTRKIPFHSISAEAALVANLSNATASNFPLNISTDCPESLQQIINSCLDRDPARRHDAFDVTKLLKSAYDQQVNNRIKIIQQEQKDLPQESSAVNDSAEKADEVDAPTAASATIAAVTAALVPPLQNLRLFSNSSASTASSSTTATETFYNERTLNLLRENEILKQQLQVEREEKEKERRERAILEEARQQNERRQRVEEAARLRETARQLEEARIPTIIPPQVSQPADIHPSSFFTQHSYVQRNYTSGSNYGGVSTGLRHISSGSANGRELFTGPRGGTFYINSSGNKTYVRR